MNDKRTNFVLPESHSIRITGNYLVGILEGDGSFYLSKQEEARLRMTVRVSLITTTVNRPVLEKIRDFILSLLDDGGTGGKIKKLTYATCRVNFLFSPA